MSQKQISQWRTVGVAVVFAVLLTSILGISLWVRDPTEITVKLFENFGWTLFMFLAAAAGKSSIEHLASGGGVKGAVRALLTDAKPGDPPPPTPPGAGQ